MRQTEDPKKKTNEEGDYRKSKYQNGKLRTKGPSEDWKDRIWQENEDLGRSEGIGCTVFESPV